MSYRDVRQYRTDSLEDEKEVAHADGSQHKITPQPTVGLEVFKAKDKLIDCVICNKRKVPFMPAFYCKDCIILWFLSGDECVMEAERLWWSKDKDKGTPLTLLEWERVHWNMEHKDLHTNWQPFCLFIREQKPELVEQIPVTVAKSGFRQRPRG